mmetsp:Transcript_109440/g.308806  ORF Transcript_109440/g.308806 Transcript_109440/m.308806 type:complete len:242 (+) Transcript_109440:281-1006(+)
MRGLCSPRLFGPRVGFHSIHLLLQPRDLGLGLSTRRLPLARLGGDVGLGLYGVTRSLLRSHGTHLRLTQLHSGLLCGLRGPQLCSLAVGPQSLDVLLQLCGLGLGLTSPRLSFTRLGGCVGLGLLGALRHLLRGCGARLRLAKLLGGVRRGLRCPNLSGLHVCGRCLKLLLQLHDLGLGFTNPRLPFVRLRGDVGLGFRGASRRLFHGCGARLRLAELLGSSLSGLSSPSLSSLGVGLCYL